MRSHKITNSMEIITVECMIRDECCKMRDYQCMIFSFISQSKAVQVTSHVIYFHSNKLLHS